MIAATTKSVLAEVADERSHQDARWGQQNWPDGTSEVFRQLAKTARQACDQAAEGGYVTWSHILLEELLEAMSETAPPPLRRELIQLAAVAVNWIEAIDRRCGVSPGESLQICDREQESAPTYQHLREDT